jgi:hypothetical protein
VTARPLLALTLAVVAACGPRPAPAQTPTPAPAADSTQALVPAGLGQLNQDVVTIRLRSSNLEIRFTPLDERIIRLLANDAYRSLSSLVDRNRAQIDSIATRQGIHQPGLVLVSFFALAPGTAFDPNLLSLDARGRVFRPVAFVPLTASWGAQRLDVRTQAMGLALFRDALPVTEPFVVGYLDASTDDWGKRLTRFDRERARIQAKASDSSLPSDRD